MSEKTVLEKNLEMWEKFVSGNMDLMFTSMEKAMESSQAFQAQVTKAVNSAVATQFEATLTALKALERQVEALSEKVDEVLQARSKE